MFLRPQSSRNLAQLRNANMGAMNVSQVGPGQQNVGAPPPAGPPMGPVDQTGVAGPTPQVGYMAQPGIGGLIGGVGSMAGNWMAARNAQKDGLHGMQQRWDSMDPAMKAQYEAGGTVRPGSPGNMGRSNNGMSPMRAQLMRRMLMSRMGGPMMGAQ